ncbi:DnaJ family domain-containing protein [Nostocoides australiense]
MPRPDPAPSLAFYNPAAFAFDAEVAIALLADLQICTAVARGDFDDLPGSGKPLDLPEQYDPDWWLKSMFKRERLVLLPPSIQLRKDDAALDDLLDEIWSEAEVRHEVELFNERVIGARYDLMEDPPLITMPRDVEATVTAWADRKAARAAAARRAHEEARAREEALAAERRRRRLFRRRRRRA